MGTREDWWDDPGDDLVLHPASAARTRTRTRRDAGLVDEVVTGLLLSVAVLAVPLFWFGVAIAQMAFVACDGSDPACHPEAGAPIGTAHLVLTVAVLIAGFVGAIVRRARRRTAWQASTATLLGILGLFIAAVVAIQVASGGHLP